MIQVSERDVREAQQRRQGIQGYPVFNPCTHTLIDLSQPVDDDTATNDMHTLTIKLSNGQFVSICVTPFHSAPGGTIDVKYHGKAPVEVIAFTPNSMPDIRAKTNMIVTVEYPDE